MHFSWRFLLVAVVVAYAMVFAAVAGEPDVTKTDAYEILGIDKDDPRLDDPGQAKQIISDAYRVAARKYRADVGQDSANFIKVTAAKKLLEDENRRTVYERGLDLSGRRARAEAAKPRPEDFLERDIADELKLLGRDVEEFIRHADLDALKEGKILDEDETWIKAVVSVFNDQMERHRAQKSKRKISITPDGYAKDRKVVGAEKMDSWNCAVVSASIPRFIQSIAEKLISIRPYPMSTVVYLRKELLSSWAAGFFAAAYGLIESSMDQVTDVETFDDLFDIYVSEFVAMSEFGEHNQKLILERYRQRKQIEGASKLSIRDDLFRRIDRTATGAMTLPELGYSVEQNTVKLGESLQRLRTAPATVDRLLNLALRASPKNRSSVLAKSISLFRLTFTKEEGGDPEDNRMNALLKRASEIDESVRAVRPAGQPNLPSYYGNVTILSSSPRGYSAPDYLYGRNFSFYLQTNYVHDFRRTLRRLMGERILRLMENIDAAQVALADSLVKDHIFETYLKAREGSAELEMCNATITANIRNVLRPPRTPGLPNPGK